MDKVLFIGMGGFFGALSRYYLSGLIQSWSRSVDFPYGTLAVNLIGCFIIGFLAHLVGAYGILSPELRLLVLVGFLGSFTTFSTFESEAFALLQANQTLLAVLDLSAHVVLGLLCVWLGQTLAAVLWR